MTTALAPQQAQPGWDDTEFFPEVSGLDVSLSSDVHASAPADAETVSEAVFGYHLSRQLRSLTVAEVADEMIEAEDEFGEAVKAGDAAAIGRMYLAVRMALAERLTARELLVDMKLTDAKEAARAAMVGEAS